MSLIIEIPKQKLIEAGDYLAELKEVRELKGKYGPVVQFAFDIVEPGYETRVTGLCSKVMTPRSKLFRWCVALGADMSQPQIDLTSLIGTRAIVSVVVITREDGEDYLNVVEVKRPSKRTPSFYTVATSSISQAPVASSSSSLPNVSYQQPQQPVPNYQQPQQPVPNYQQPQQPVPNYQQPQQPVPNYQQPYDRVQVSATDRAQQPKRNPLISEIESLDELEF